jgi:phosphohistidine phosphatase
MAAVYLVRHGEAVSEAVDPRRPLSEVGREQVRTVGNRARGNEVQPGAVFHSGILRAEQTAQLLTTELGINVVPVPTTGLMPEDDPFVAKAEIETGETEALLVGHLPHLQRLASLLVAGNSERHIVEFAPATMVCLTRADSRWQFSWMIGPDDAVPR